MENDSWLEISITVNGELAEAVAEVMSRHVKDGVAIEAQVKGYRKDGEGIIDGPVRVCAYLPVDERLENRRQRIEEDLWYLGRIESLPAIEYKTLKEQDWAEAWKTHYHPIEIGARLVIVPAWLENPSTDRIPIWMDPGMAFGTGTHPSTQLCLELIEQYVSIKAHPVPFRMIDVGCGSGILSVAALKLGASHALAVDIDPTSVRCSLENAAANGVAEKMDVQQGSVQEIRSAFSGIKQADLVVANILAPVILELFDLGLGELVLPSGWLVLAGILDHQEDQIRAALERFGFRSVTMLQRLDWIAFAASR